MTWRCPVKLPADGIVSAKIEDENPNEDYYRAIGYPLYGGRAVRIDMLDRVISCVYDHATGGKFQARHEMAEWLGCSIADLYKVLEAMGHVKAHDPADEIKDEGDAPEIERAEEKTVEDKPAAGEEKAAEKKLDVKPELATFRLKKGKASQLQKNLALARIVKKPRRKIKIKRSLLRKKASLSLKEILARALFRLRQK